MAYTTTANLVSIPKKAYITAVSAEGSTPINAFDNCLVKAGIGQISLIKVTSILPSNIEFVFSPPRYPGGANVPSIYDYVTSNRKGEILSAAIGVGFTDYVVLVAEHAEIGKDRKYAERYVRDILAEMAQARKVEIKRILIKSTEHIVSKVGCALAIITEY